MRRCLSNNAIVFFISHYKMMLYSVHDTSVAALLIALGIFDDKWPDFAADLAFELYRDKVTKYRQLTKQILKDTTLEEALTFVPMQYRSFQDGSTENGTQRNISLSSR